MVDAGLRGGLGALAFVSIINVGAAGRQVTAAKLRAEPRSHH